MFNNNLMNKKEIKEILNIDEKADGIICGALNNEIVALPFNTCKFNKNVAVFGGAGTGKTRSYVLPNILQLAEHKKSLIINDPKGELYTKLKNKLTNEKYEVKIFNLLSTKNSHRWNPLSEVKDELSAESFSQAIIDNTTSIVSKGDTFWEQEEQNLLKALTLYVIHESPEGKRTLKEIYTLLVNKDVKEIDRLFSALPSDHPAKQPYKLFSESADNVRSGMIIELGTRLQVFQSQSFQTLTETNDIDLTAPAKKPCAYFCITPDMPSPSVFSFLSKLFIACVYKNIFNYANKNGRCSNEVYFMLDEFHNMASISEFASYITNYEDKGIYFNIIIQNTMQLQDMDSILNLCDSKLFLSPHSKNTIDYISNSLNKPLDIDKLNNSNNNILLIRDQKPIILKKYLYID
ncbi:plasmid transfer factor, TraK (plasmid) [Clostridium botulinum Af84]|uniref:VirD4-like conjugal transfer protein, CD1115 family n=2 Tax=Clostridium botulinum TaxID=1491 RepID=UPI00035BA72A|nr:type IV secretory system conjugative DNA transfer family protein [Clostridium botulinum]EPS54432.1 plasmid transfer factor, TraK [Clostridium botulinum Af84]APR02875.1 DEAD/DEAH box helicase family protein [Clostridium botulinum]AUN19884.1 plasmid transfer factor, TraK [Clostridium botulinum]NFM82833.1 plasmid transfer factor, TraK [Clostridium botulinum]NFP10045.1 plasmid transfer factor, TraK [Clostridium botulinum]